MFKISLDSPKPIDFAFAVGKIRAQEVKLIKREAFQEALEVKLEESLKLFYELGDYSEEILKIKNISDLENVLKKEKLNLKKEIEEVVLDKRISILLEKFLPEELFLFFKEKSKFLMNFFSLYIDMENIKTFFRARLIRLDIEDFAKHLLNYGFINKKELTFFYLKDIAAFLKKLETVYCQGKVYDYSYFLKEAIEQLEKQETFLYLEKAINDFLIEYLKPAKFISFGIEPIIGFYFAKLNEINLIKKIIVAKLTFYKMEKLKEILNKTYV